MFLPEKVLKSWDVLRRFWGRALEEILKTSPGRGLEDLSWKMSLGRLMKDVLKTSPGRRLDDVLKKDCLNFHFRPIREVFETKAKTFLRRLSGVFASARVHPVLLLSLKFFIYLIVLLPRNWWATFQTGSSNRSPSISLGIFLALALSYILILKRS